MGTLGSAFSASALFLLGKHILGSLPCCMCDGTDFVCEGSKERVLNRDASFILMFCCRFTNGRTDWVHGRREPCPALCPHCGQEPLPAPRHQGGSLTGIQMSFTDKMIYC